jgi:membrane protease YdiL (CAAX protease family)
MAFCAGWLVFTQIHFTVAGFDLHVRPWLKNWDGYLKPMLGHLYWFWWGPVALFLIPLGVGCRALRMQPAQLGVALGHWRSGLKWTLGIFGVFLPVVIAVSFTAPFKGTYPMNGFVATEAVNWLMGKGGSPWPFLLYEFSYGAYFVGWEFFFRGLIGFSLFQVMGWYSVFVATLPFAVMHVGKPEPEALGSVIAGVALGVFALKERSFIYGALLHALVAWSMDVLAIVHRWRDSSGK